MVVGLGPFDTPSSDSSFRLTVTDAEVRFGAATLLTASNPGTVTAGSHHVAMTYDGSFLILYLDGAEVARAAGSNQPISPDANENLYIAGGPFEPNTQDNTVSHVAFYTYALSAAQVANHATAAVSRGYTAQLTGSRIASLATHALWSTAHIGAGSYTVMPRMQTGQRKLDEILETVNAEQPFGMFWFDDQGRPAYSGANYDTTIQATFGDSGSDIRYQDITVAYDDQLYNSVTASRDGGPAKTRTDSASVTAYGARGYSAEGLILSNDADVDLVAAGIQEHFSQPQLRVTSITLNGATQAARTQLLTRDIGDTIRVRRRGDTPQPIDVVTRILAKTKQIDTNGNLTCTWTLARGFPGAAQVWRLGQAGYSEVGATTILG
jgi:hypothetical protein